MKKILLLMFTLLWGTSPLLAEEDPLAAAHRSLKDGVFVVETDEDSVSDSLNRISGNIDLGFSAPEQSYDSADHYSPGPFGRSEISDKASREDHSY